ncbi:MAG: NADH-quinone oxidoreductase subunit NuoE [Nitrospira sp.]|jgi:NADH-quinone oxidoreductase subunit E|nr:NADH-quinone oxidoreductase subunit NuoE [Nitrospira sp. BO4]
MLSDAERRELEDAVTHYPDKRGAAIDALLTIQRRRGWISDDTLLEIAQFLEITAEDLDSIATFYNLVFRKPVGRHVAFVCDSISCWIKGCEQVQEQIKTLYEVDLGQTSPDGRLTVLPIACLGQCERAPALMIDQDVYGDVTPEKIGQIVEKYK